LSAFSFTRAISTVVTTSLAMPHIRFMIKPDAELVEDLMSESKEEIEDSDDDNDDTGEDKPDASVIVA
jgi:hypothetical protein